MVFCLWVVHEAILTPVNVTVEQEPFTGCCKTKLTLHRAQNLTPFQGLVLLTAKTTSSQYSA